MYFIFIVVTKHNLKKMRSPVTTITGLILALVAVFGTVGLLSSDQVIELSNSIPLLIEAIASIILIFKAKD